MLFRPCLLHRLIVRVKLVCFVAQIHEVLGIEIRDAKEALIARSHLLLE
jgi:hypothetical protein